MTHTPLLAESYLHQLDPVIFSLSGSLSVRWYGLAYLTGFLIAWLLIKWLVRTGRSVIPAAAVGDLMVFIIAGVLIGGRLGYVIFYDPSLLISFSSTPPWWELLNLPRGGMASHGGIIGVTLALLLFARRHHLPGLHLLDIASFIVPPGLFLGRIANFINGELWGKAIPQSLQQNPPWWSVKYPDEVMMEHIDVSSLTTHIGGDQTLREQVIQSIRQGDQLTIDTIVPQLTAWWPSQLIQAFAEGPILWLALFVCWWTPKKPGVISGVFLCTYGALRIITELFRQPDEGVALIIGLQRGQLLSVWMILLGVVLVVWCHHRSVNTIGGFSAQPAPSTPPSKPLEHASDSD